MTEPSSERLSKNTDFGRIAVFLSVVALLWIENFGALYALRPAYIAQETLGQTSFRSLLYAAIGLLISTPMPFWAALVVALWCDKKKLKVFLKNIFRARKPLRAVAITAVFCGLALTLALIKGVPNGEPWYLLPAGFVVMIPFVGIAEEAGWRGVLQPTLEKHLPFPVATVLTAAVWWVWHADLWADPTSRHYGDSFLGFGICIFIWAFSLAVLYRATGSIFACAAYHAFMDAIGAVYDWNLLFDPFPGDLLTNGYRAVVLGLSAAIWLYCDKKDAADERK